ncbi:hypothetical protein QAD02_001531 [Eretmocerus hayati]|uniref:Uncharacterized protein n=1 Tax=Eretmocerus hayati TaxID=131215 RepID=A0ACC2NJ61_9HYME|nr:hypothetical protein QAD02_001531 [Eretmocerus hayati]
MDSTDSDASESPCKRRLSSSEECGPYDPDTPEPSWKRRPSSSGEYVYSTNSDTSEPPARMHRLSSSDAEFGHYNESFYNNVAHKSSSENEAGDGDDEEGRSWSSKYASRLSDSEEHENENSKSQNDSHNSDQSDYSKEEKVQKGSVAERMMQKWGFKKGKGLGRELQGRAEPVAASTQKGRRGLGLELKELQRAQIEFDPDTEIVQVEEEILWLENKNQDLPSEEELAMWESERAVGERRETIDGETMFCDGFIVQGVVDSKSIFDRLDKKEMLDARTRSNPFETIKGSIFLNRAAVKMANMDKACDFMFTRPPNLEDNELLYFADVCAGPGGFSEYVLYRKGWEAKGFGFTLKNENDFKLHDFHAGPCESFHPYYGPKENGDVYDPENQKAFKDLIMRETNNQGVHFMMADGGFSVEGQENIQEILSKQLYLCQCLVGLMIVRTGGHFVTKVFDLFTPFSAGLVYIMFRCFNDVSIFKPNTSRPANSERYLICRNKRPHIEHIEDYLFKANQRLLRSSKKNDLLELVPVDKLTSEEDFFNYLKQSNETLGERQIVGLKKIAAYTENKEWFEGRQQTMREQCLKHWELPTGARVLPRRMNPSAKVQDLLENSVRILEKSSNKDALILTKDNVYTTILSNEKPCFDWYCMPCSSGESDSSREAKDKTPTFFLGTGRSQTYKYVQGRWEPVQDIDLPRDTLVYAELIQEFRREWRSQSKTYGLHIIDAFTLGSKNVSKLYLTERIDLIKLFCKALWKPLDSQFLKVRVKDLFPVDLKLVEELKLDKKQMKNGSQILAYSPPKPTYETDGCEPYYYIPRCVLFFKATNDPWARHKSRIGKKYFYNRKNGISVWEIKEIPPEAKSDFANTLQTRVLWNWPFDKSMTMEELIDFIERKYHNPLKI